MSKVAGSVDLNGEGASPGEVFARQQDLLSYRLSTLSRLIDRSRDAKLVQNFALSLTESRVLGFLAESSPQTVRGLSKTMYLDKAQVSRAVTGLVGRGYAIREVDPDDGRSALFFITRKGRALFFEDMLVRARRGQAELVSGLSAQERQVLSHAIDVLLDHLSAQRAESEDSRSQAD